MKKSHLILFLVVAVCFVAGIIYSATVQTRTIRTKPFQFNLQPGDRILVINKDADTYIRIRPSEARVFDYKVPEGKTLSGILTER